MGHKCDGCRYRGEHQEMMFRPFGVCTKELNLIDAEKVYNADKCPYKKTNADRIRAMSDEELAGFLRGIAYTGREPWSELFEQKFCRECPEPEYTLDDGRKLNLHECEFSDGTCPHGSDAVWWLQQPAE